MKLKHILILQLWLTVLPGFCTGQPNPVPDSLAQMRLYHTVIMRNNQKPGHNRVTGCLYALTDSSVTLVPGRNLREKLWQGFLPTLTVIPLSSIQYIHVRQMGKPGFYAVLGGLAGALTGIIVGSGSSGFLSGPQLTAGMAGILAIPGVLLGATLGSIPNEVVRLHKGSLSVSQWQPLEKYTVQKQLHPFSTPVPIPESLPGQLETTGPPVVRH